MIEFSEVRKSFGDHVVLDGISFTAPDGKVTGLVGPNGAGKSTAFKILLGLLPADSGTCLVDGMPYAQCPNPGNALGVTFGPEWIPSRMTGEGYLSYVSDLKEYGGERTAGGKRTAAQRKQEVHDLLALVGLSAAADDKVGSYSLGMRQRLGLASALVGQPHNLVLDEPVNGLDIEGVRWVRDYLHAAAASGRSVLLSSHILSELEMVADDIVMLSQGRVVRSGSLQQVRTSAARTHGVIVTTNDIPGMLALLQSGGFSAQATPHGVRVADADIHRVASCVGNGSVPVHSIACEEASLEDAFLQQIHSDAGAQMRTSQDMPANAQAA